MHHYTLAYSAIATNVAASTLAAAMAAVPVPLDPLAPLGLSITSDTASSSATVATRTIVMVSSTGPLPDSQIAGVLTNYLTPALARACSTPVTAASVVVT